MDQVKRGEGDFTWTKVPLKSFIMLLELKKRVISLGVYGTSVLVMSTIKGFRFHSGGRIRSHSSFVYVRHSRVT